MKNLENLLNELNTELKGKDINLCALDNEIMSYGIDSAYDNTDPDEVLEMGSVSYWVDDNQWINVVFEVVSIDEEEPINSVVKVKCVEEL